ncbi:hypothetical protein GOBAR_DD25809 [Gossypium barbadense]|nr:hypothetical protein GOBAR_DD25809 [Gossypium barbadense]
MRWLWWCGEGREKGEWEKVEVLVVQKVKGRGEYGWSMGGKRKERRVREVVRWGYDDGDGRGTDGGGQIGSDCG